MKSLSLWHFWQNAVRLITVSNQYLAEMDVLAMKMKMLLSLPYSIQGCHLILLIAPVDEFKGQQHNSLKLLEISEFPCKASSQFLICMETQQS